MRDRCMCLGVQGDWNVENGYHYPFLQQGTLHSPMGCMMAPGPRDLHSLRRLYRDLTSQTIDSNDLAAVFQAVLAILKTRPDVKVPAVLFPRPLTPQATPCNVASKGTKARRPRPPAVTRTLVVTTPGPYPKPWEKKSE